jgi:hypothetical protein
MSSSDGYTAKTHEVIDRGPNSQRPNALMPGTGHQASKPGKYPANMQGAAGIPHATARAVRQRSVALPPTHGTTFAASELILIQSWAEFHDLSVSIEFDSFWDSEPLDEAIALYPADSPYRRWTLVRHVDAVETRHVFGERRILRSVPEALDSMIAPFPESPCENVQLVKDAPRF